MVLPLTANANDLMPLIQGCDHREGLFRVSRERAPHAGRGLVRRKEKERESDVPDGTQTEYIKMFGYLH